MKYGIVIMFVLVGCASEGGTPPAQDCGSELGTKASWSPIDVTDSCSEAASKLNKDASSINLKGDSACDVSNTDVDTDTCSAHYEGFCSGVEIVIDCDVTVTDADCLAHIKSDEYDCNMNLRLGL